MKNVYTPGLWVLEVYDKPSKESKEGTWKAWKDYAFETYGQARKAARSHRASCWTEVRIRKYERAKNQPQAYAMEAARIVKELFSHKRSKS